MQLSPPQVKRRAKEIVQAARARGEIMNHQTALDLVAQTQGIKEGWLEYKRAWKNRRKTP